MINPISYTQAKALGNVTLTKEENIVKASFKQFDQQSGQEIAPVIQLSSVEEITSVKFATQNDLNTLEVLLADSTAL